MTPAPSRVILHYPSLVQWLADCLATAIAKLEGADLADAIATESAHIPLPLFALDPQVLGTFATPLPLKLARQHQTTPEQMGAQLIEQVNLDAHQSGGLMPKLWLHPNGWLYAHFLDLEITAWLQRLLAASPMLKALTPSFTLGVSADPLLFQLQYTHARCCSLLRLGQQMQRIELTDEPIKTAKLVLPQPIPWLMTTHQWRLQRPTELQLVRLLMQFPQLLSAQKVIYGRSDGAVGLDITLSWPLPTVHLRRHAQQWSSAFLQFYGECRLFTVDSPDGPEQSQVRLALIYLFRQVTAFWLEALFQIEAPTVL